MTSLFQNINLLHNFFTLIFIFEMACIYWFNSDELLCDNLQCNVDFTKGTFTQYLTNSVEFYSSRGTFSIILERFLDVFTDFFVLLLPRWSWAINRFLSFNTPIIFCSWLLCLVWHCQLLSLPWWFTRWLTNWVLRSGENFFRLEYLNFVSFRTCSFMLILLFRFRLTLLDNAPF